MSRKSRLYDRSHNWRLVEADGEHHRRYSNIVCLIHSMLHEPTARGCDPDGREIRRDHAVQLWNYWEAITSDGRLGEDRWNKAIKQAEQMYRTIISSGATLAHHPHVLESE